MAANTEDSARQRNLHGKGPAEPTTKNQRTAKALGIIVRQPGTHNNSAFVVRFSFVVRHMAFSFVFFLSILFHLILIFIFLFSFTF
jgi:hypothetical protein